MLYGLVALVSILMPTWAGDPLSDNVGCKHEAIASHGDPGRCSKHASLMGFGNCSWSTSRMAERVLHDGSPYSFVGSLSRSDNRLESKVAAPYTVGPQSEIHVIANEVLEGLKAPDVTELRLELQGKLLVVDGVQYLVVTHIGQPNS